MIRIDHESGDLNSSNNIEYIRIDRIKSKRSSFGSIETMNETARVSITGSSKPDQLLEILEETQLECFWPKLRDQLQITRLVHFDYVKIKDLEKIGMSKPAIRRLLDAVHRHKRKGDSLSLGKILPSRPPPPPPSPLTSNATSASIRFNHDQQTRSRVSTLADRLLVC